MKPWWWWQDQDNFFMKDFIFLCKEIIAGKSVTRAYLNKRLKIESLQGKIIDIGGGHSSIYISKIKKEQDFVIETFDVKAGKSIDFEKDTLPIADSSQNTVLFLNVLEHVYNHQHIANELYRIVKPGGKLIGFVPFLMWYHPDHEDYFRYTNTALNKIITTAGGKDFSVETIAHGPFTAAAHMILQSFPRLIRIFVFVPLHFLDTLYLWLRPGQGSRFALGYYFSVKKH